MARDFYINGETMVYVKGRSDSGIGSLQELGLSEGPIRLNFGFFHSDIRLDAWGSAGVPADVQWMLGTVNITMNLIHIDKVILNICISESMGGVGDLGLMGRAGTRLGNNLPRFSPGEGTSGNHYIGLNLASPIQGVPWRFFTTYLTSQPLEIPLGTEKSVFTLNWRAIPYVQDPWRGGSGALNYPLWSHTVDT